MRLYSKAGQEEMAGLAMKGSTKTPVPALRDKLRDVEEIVPGSEPTTFQATGDYGLGQLERGVATKEQAPFAERRAEQAAARQGALEKDVIRPGNPEEVANDLRARMKAEDAAAEAAEKAAIARAEATTQAATARAEAADRAAGGTGFTPDISGQVFQRELTEANTASRNAASRLWDDIDPQGRLSVDASPVINAEFRARSNMTLADAESVTDAERAIQRVINSYGPVTSFREMRSLRSLISTSMREERRRAGESPAWGRMAELRGMVEQSVAAPFERGVPAGPQQAAMSADAAERLAAATAATKERAATFKVEPIQGVIRPGQGGELRATPSTVPGKIIPTGPKGYDTVNAYLRATGGRGLQDVSEALVADMRAYATDVNGNLDPGRVMSWARGKQHALRAVTERDGGALARRLEEVQTSGFGVKAATKEQARTIKEAAAERAAVSKKGNEGIFGDLMGVRDKEDISKLIGSVFGSKTAVNDAREIMSRLTTPEAQDGARRAITDWMTNRLVSNTAAGTTEIDILKADQFQTFIKGNGAVLREFGFTPEQIKTMELIAKDLRRAKMSIDATKVPGGSNTAQDLYAMKKFGLQGSNLSKVLHLLGGATGGLTAGPLGAAIGFLSAGRVKVLRDRGIKSVQELLVEGMVDPAVGHMLLGKSLPQERIAFWRTVGKFGARAARTSIITGGPHPDQSAPAGYASGGAVRPLGREGIKTRNKARAAAARERSSLARGAAKAKGKVGYAEGGEVKDRWAELPSSSNVEDRRSEAPLSIGQLVAGNQAFMGHYPSPYTRGSRKPPTAEARADGGEVAPYQEAKLLRAGAPGAEFRELEGVVREKARRQVMLSANGGAVRRFASGGGINADSSEPDPLDAELARRNVPGGLSATAGPTVTSTTPVQDIPAPKVNAEGETLPTYVLKEMGKQIVGTPERLTHVGGDLQRRGEYAGSHEDLPSFGPPPEEMPAGLETALGLYGFNAPFAKPGLGIFGGKGAKTANLPKLAEAEQMLKEGVPHATIRNRTGWEFGADGKPRFEISDAEARIRPEHPEDRIYEADAASRATGFRPNQRMEQQLEHQAAYEAYPWLKDMKTTLEVGEGIKPGAEYAPPTKYSLKGSHGDIAVNAPTYERGGVGDLFGKQYASDVGARDMLLHEMQHAIQEHEKFAPGSNPRGLPLAKSEVTTLTRNMAKRQGIDYDAASPKDKADMERVIRYRIYKAQAGEAEARNVQTRADSTLPSRPSWETEDVAREHQMIEKTGKLKRGEKPFKDAKIYKLEREPGTEVRTEPVPGSPEWRDAPNPNAPFPQYAEQYPPVGPPKIKPKTDFKTGKPVYGPDGKQLTFEAKQQTPDAEAFMKERARVIKDMDENGYHPYFDENARFDVDPKNYPLNTDTIQIVPKTLNKLAEHFYKIGSIETRRALQAAYSRGRLLGGGRGPDFVGPGGAGPEFVGPMQRLTTQDWYMMGQLEQDLVRQMGPKAGRAAFREKFATSMAATTGGMKPRDNLIAAGYQNYLAAKGQRWPEQTHQWPTPVASQYGSQLSNTAQRIQDEGGFKGLGVGGQNPKRHNFAGDFMGHRKPGTMDEQMSDLMQPGKTQPDWYGLNEHVMAQEAEKAGADPRMFQETGWAGHKNAAGGPMIREVNHTIERIHRLTGMARSEIVRRAWGKGDIPVYGAAGLAALKALEEQVTGEE
jgi:hypothetical protein